MREPLFASSSPSGLRFSSDFLFLLAANHKYNITPEQFDKATYCESNGKGFYIVESQSEAGKEFHVKYNVLSCTCKAGKNGVPCWHKRAALVAEEHYKVQVRCQERLDEQARIEATEEYQFEMLLHELETTLDELDRIAEESDRRAALQRA